MTRRDEILKLIVEYFIRTAEPVGSKTLLEKYDLNCSSATIRNEMNALEKDGMLEKPHTSAGRVPSQKGYEYYVANLRESDVDDKVKYALASVFSEKAKSVEEVMKESCEILSHMTNLASIVLGPSSNEEALASVQLIPLSSNSATAVFVTDKGYVENKTFIVEENLALADVQKMVQALNERLIGTKISEIVPKMEAMKPALQDYYVGEKAVYEALLSAFIRFTGERIQLYGKDALFSQPEFATDMNKLKNLLSFIEDPKAFRNALKETKSTSSGVKVGIGGSDRIGDVAVVSCDLNLPGNPSLTVLGPSRMDYEKVMATVKYLADAIDEYFGTNEGGNQCQKTKKSSTNKNSPTMKKNKNPKTN